MSRDYNNMPVLRMSLENVAKDFHLRVIESHNEIQKFIEDNLDKTIENFINTEFPKLLHSLITEAFRNVVFEKFKNDKDIKELIEKAVDDSLKKAVSEAIKEHLTDDILWATDKTQKIRDIMEGTRAWEIISKLWKKESDHE